MTDFSPLFTPFRLGKFTLPNRIVFPPMGLQVCEGGVPGEEAAQYYARRAEGGASLVITEGVYIDHPSSGDNPLLGRFHGEDAFAGWRNVAARVHASGGICVPELWHVGLIYSGPDVLTGGPLAYRPELGQVSPSGYIDPASKVCEGMTQTEIDDVIAAYARGAHKAVELGFDGIELHGGHGYLIDQFLWKALNHRTDGYGGSPRARGQFVADVIRACRAELEPGMPLILRISQWKMVDYNARLAETPQELEELLGPAVEAGVDLIDCSQRRFWEPAFDDGCDLNLAGWVRKVTGVPTCTIGSVGLDSDFFVNLGEGKTSGLDLAGLDELMRRFDRGDFDLVAIGRSMIAEPDWPKLVRAGRFDRLRPFTPKALDDALMAHVTR
ncbi:NADH:flavin oxidoreductase [Novosphingobium mangrovi (ex Huang et al. 2023)]|uniref:NADH:flavin oxidoreductase n=1 Tax=Novosphingobium mangrovi (ex Huang et al. 2023) TaxID=2976432 RepID=A0ABT2HZK1_9SPHN|nr:NADH:flavin oxidoreductase [Novosphingobium mangrovi (ex Huang et al. 2023)]MCT2397966.1 NADH:flavin oxidoreductase [Novosphingobium mangrovi (ex Huang et al. 2023)]